MKESSRAYRVMFGNDQYIVAPVLELQGRTDARTSPTFPQGRQIEGQGL